MLMAAPLYGRKMVFVITNRQIHKKNLLPFVPRWNKNEAACQRKTGPKTTNFTMVIPNLTPPSARDWLALL